MTGRSRAQPTALPGRARPAAWVRRGREALRAVRPVGWVVLAVALLGLVAGILLDWRELALVGAAAVVVLLLAAPFLLGRSRVAIELALDPQRVVAGGSVSAALRVVNPTGSRIRPLLLDLPVGQAVHRYDLPGLAVGGSREEVFTIRTERRGVIPVGPATIRRGDPLGLMSRDSTWGGVTEIFVRPEMVPVETLGAGLLRDLEGRSTDAISESDLAFHALREYAPGDDLRHVHWRSSAKLAATGNNQLLVRQYLDTRRSHVTFVVEDRVSGWGSEEDFETALAAVASLIGRAVLDEIETSLVVGDAISVGGSGRAALDDLCRATTGRVGLIAAAAEAAVKLTETSLLFLVGGSGTDFATFQRAASAFEIGVRRIALRIDPTGPDGQGSRVVEAGDLPVLGLAKLGDLPALLHWSLR